MPRSTDELIARSEELADEFEAYDPAPGGQHEPPLMAVRRLVYKLAGLHERDPRTLRRNVDIRRDSQPGSSSSTSYHATEASRALRRYAPSAPSCRDLSP